MCIEEFMNSISSASPPHGLNDLLVALWWDRKGDWDRAHAIAQENHTRNGSKVHAYLHRVEGDLWNAGYWYEKANTVLPDSMSLEEECERLIKELL